MLRRERIQWLRRKDIGLDRTGVSHWRSAGLGSFFFFFCEASSSHFASTLGKAQFVRACHREYRGQWILNLCNAWRLVKSSLSRPLEGPNLKQRAVRLVTLVQPMLRSSRASSMLYPKGFKFISNFGPQSV